MKISKDSVRERENSVRNTGALLKVKHTKYFFQLLTLGSDGGRAIESRLKSCEERLGCVALERKKKGQPLGSCA